MAAKFDVTDPGYLLKSLLLDLIHTTIGNQHMADVREISDLILLVHDRIPALERDNRSSCRNALVRAA
jgi:hypothetical protein